MTFWLASFPRSGNTLLRQVLHAGWGVVSGSVFRTDLGDNLALIRACGHVDLKMVRRGEGWVFLNPNDVPVKTHFHPDTPEERGIYIMRDGRAACVSLWHFWKREIPLDAIVRGQARFGGWSDHVLAWTERARPDLVVRYEAMLENPAALVAALSERYGQPHGDPLAPLRERSKLAQVDGTWVRPPSDWRSHWSRALEDLFQQHNSPAFARFYGSESPASPAAPETVS